MAKSRYTGVRSKRKELTSKFKKVQSPEHFETTYYKSVPKKNDDMYFITQDGDRLDLLAHRFYGDPNLWWFLARANNLSSMNVEAGIQIRVPINSKDADIKINRGQIK